MISNTLIVGQLALCHLKVILYYVRSVLTSNTKFGKIICDYHCAMSRNAPVTLDNTTVNSGNNFLSLSSINHVTL